MILAFKPQRTLGPPPPARATVEQTALALAFILRATALLKTMEKPR
jgi:hypothetical protein